MSQSSSGQLSESIPVSRSESFLIQEKLSARQATRAAKAAERGEKSDALKKEGNAFFRCGNYLDALDRYQQAIDVHGPSVKPILLSNLAATYLKLGLYSEAHDAASRALAADPKSMNARYCRGLARTHLKMWTAADIDFCTLLALDPENKDAKDALAFMEEKRLDPSYWVIEDEYMASCSDYEAPLLEDDPQPGESLSESSDCEHTGNGIPCKFYNRRECKNGRVCRFSHAPDEKSERDALGRNVCRYYLIGVCKFGDRCSYLHSKEYLLQGGWWSTSEGIEKERKQYNLVQICNKASGIGQTSKKKQTRGKRKRDDRSRSGLGGSRSETERISPAETRHPSQGIGKRSKTKLTIGSYSRWDGYDSDGDNRNGMCGFTGREVEELVSYGVKPWDDDAWDVWHAMHEY